MHENHEQFLELLLRSQTEIKAFIGSVIRDRVSRDDVFQEVASILWRRFSAFDQTKSFAAWARGVAANKIIHEIRQSKRFPTPLEPQAIEAVLRAFDRMVSDSNDRQDALATCLEQLPERSRQLLVLKYELDLDATEISEQLGMKIDSIYQSLSRLRAKLASCVDGRLGLEGGSR